MRKVLLSLAALLLFCNSFAQTVIINGKPQAGAVSIPGGPPVGIVLAGDSITAFVNSVANVQAVSATSNIATLGTIVPGSSYTNGTYTSVPLTGGAGSGAIGTVIVSGGAVTGVTVTTPGTGYALLDSLTAAAANIGGTGSGFSVPVATIGTTYSNVVKITLAGHGLGPGQRCELNGVYQSEYNGIWTVSSVVDANNFTVTLSSPATVPNPVGYISTLGTVTHGTLYTTGTYTNVPLTGGTGSGALATVVVSGGGVQTVTVTYPGTQYSVSDSLSASAANIGGTGSGFSVPVASLGVLQIARGNTFGNAGYWQYSSGYKLQLLNNAGLGGDTAITGLATSVPGLSPRLPKDVFAYNPQLVSILIGINDVANGTVTATQIATAIQAIANACLAQNIKVILGTLPPTGPGWGSYSTANAKTIIEVNRQLRAYVAATQGVVLADYYAALVDPSSTVGNVLPANTLDGLHPSAQGAYLMSQAFNAAVNTAFAVPQIAQTSSLLDAYANNTTSYNILPNGLMTGTGGSVNGTGSVSGTGPTSWTMTSAGTSPTMAMSTVARTIANDGDTIGYDVVGTFTPSGNGDNITIRTNNTAYTALSGGQWIYGDCDMKWSGLNIKSVYMYEEVTTAAGNVFAYFGATNSTAMTGTVTTPIASPGVVTWSESNIAAGTAVSFSGGTLPTGITTNTVYYVLPTALTANTFEIAATPGGTAINFTGTSSGTQTGSCLSCSFPQSFGSTGKANPVKFPALYVPGTPTNTSLLLQATYSGATASSNTIQIGRCEVRYSNTLQGTAFNAANEENYLQVASK